jgi:FtsP/CotA-like multicopper oxidase with cupredoxin domain
VASGHLVGGNLAATLTVDYIEDNPGRWLYHCHVTDHMMGGMIGYYDVTA